MKEVDLLLAERAELRNQLRDRGMESQRAPLDERQSEDIGELLGDGHRGEHGILAEPLSRLAVRKALDYVEDDPPAARYLERDAITTFGVDVATDRLDDAVQTLDVESLVVRSLSTHGCLLASRRRITSALPLSRAIFCTFRVSGISSVSPQTLVRTSRTISRSASIVFCTTHFIQNSSSWVMSSTIRNRASARFFGPRAAAK